VQEDTSLGQHVKLASAWIWDWVAAELIFEDWKLVLIKKV